MPELSLLPFPKQSALGWGRYPKGESHVMPVQAAQDALYGLRQRAGHTVIGRGEGRAYGDAAMNRGHLCLDFTPSDRFLAFDEATGRLHAQAGVTLERILETFIPRGWFLPVTPGTKYPTLGGCVACDVHGKSKHSLGHYLARLHMLLADGSLVACSPEEKPDLFWATVGGMGLTGLILSVELNLQKIESSYLRYQGIKARNLEEIFKLFEEPSDLSLTVSWIDCLARGRSLGRSIMMRGDFAQPAAAGKKNPLAVMHKPKVTVPFDFPSFCLNPLSVAVMNTGIYGKHPRRLETIMDYDSFFYPLDSILHWNRGYGRPGMLQYQFLIPTEKSFDGIRALLEAISRTGKASFLAVLKKFGPIVNRGLISFPMPGYFLALDFPVGNGEILKHMDAWDEIVLKYGGRIYLAKDSRMRPETFAAMYPRLKEWKAVKAKYDPQGIFSSDLSRRLQLEV